MTNTPKETPPDVLHHWPYCPECKRSFSFDPHEPYAYCGCPGTTEWGNPRPASWIPDPSPIAVIGSEADFIAAIARKPDDA